MRLSWLHSRICALVLFCIIGVDASMAQDVLVPKAQQRRQNLTDSVTLSQLDGELDSLQLAILKQARDSIAALDSIRSRELAAQGVVVGDSVVNLAKKPFIPDPKKALWLAIAFPGGGQIYNHKYWKLPIVYGGFLGCYYALSWNNNMYRDYSQAYIDIMAKNPATHSYMNFLPPSYDVEANKERLKDIFRRKKDFYRRYRDMSFFCMLAVYGLSIIDAYVDAELSSFDISPDLSMKVKPSVIHDGNNYLTANKGLVGDSFGMKCSFEF